MSIVNDFIQTHAVELVGKLVDAGFSNGQAQEFLKETPLRVMEIMGPGHGLERLKACDSAHISLVIGEIDIQALAHAVDVDVHLANAGLEAVVPRLWGFTHCRIPERWSERFLPTVH